MSGEDTRSVKRRRDAGDGRNVMRARWVRGREEGAILSNLMCRREQGDVEARHGVIPDKHVRVKTHIVNDIEVINDRRFLRRQRDSE